MGKNAGKMPAIDYDNMQPGMRRSVQQRMPMKKWLGTILFNLATTSSTQAQIVPDATLLVNSIQGMPERSPSMRGMQSN